MVEIRMPKMGDGMEEGTINSWHKKEGDMVTSGEVIAEVETDKANVEINAYDTGVLTQILVKEGETVPVGAVIAQLGGTKEEHQNAPVAEKVSVAVSKPAEEKAVVTPSSNGISTVDSSERVKASPLARRMMRDMKVNPALVKSTGPGGRIIERDVTAFLDTFKETQVQAVSSQTVVDANAVTAKSVTSEIKPSRMREAIARRTVLSKQTIPHFYVSMVIDMGKAQLLLKELNTDNPDGKVTVNDLIVKACALALGNVPVVNSSWTAENTIRQYTEAHIGIAVGIEDGLIIPVVRNCESKTLRQISATTKSLVGKARNGQLKPDEYTGATFSISNLGMMGVDEFTAIISPPESAIIAIGGIFKEAVVRDDDSIVVCSRMKVMLSADHRILDGVSAAKFLQEVKKALESPFSLLS